MIRKPIAILTYIATLALMGTISSGRAIGQQGEPHYSLKELHRLVATASDTGKPLKTTKPVKTTKTTTK